MCSKIHRKKCQVDIRALFGGERFLKLLVIKNLLNSLLGENAEFNANHSEGDSADWPDVVDQLSTMSLFGGDDPRIVIINNADGFVTKFRGRLEGYVKSPPSRGLMILDVGKWPSNTKLYKAIDKSGLQIQCDAPFVKRGRGKQPDEKKIADWLVAWAQTQHSFELPANCARTLMELTDCDFGRMDQELGRTALLRRQRYQGRSSTNQTSRRWLATETM